MTKFARHALLALSFLVGFAPAFAAPPPPVPALPDTSRITTYTPTASTGPFNVGFDVYGDGSDYGNWVEVWLNGTKLTPVTNFTLTSPTGVLTVIPRPVTDARITLASPATGTLQIVGARRPRRVSQFPENRGVTARDFNQVLNDMTSQNREFWDIGVRTMKARPGSVVGLLPYPSDCIGRFLGFDGTGAQPVCLTGGPGSGNVVGPPSSTSGNFALYDASTGALLRDGGNYANHGVVIGRGAGNGIGATVTLSNGQMLIGQAGADPSPKSISGDATVDANGVWTNASAAGGFDVKLGALQLLGLNSGVEVGSKTVTNTPFIDFHSSSNNIDYDTRLVASGGSSTVGTGFLGLIGTFNITPQANSMAQGFNVTQSGVGTLTGTNRFDYNLINIPSDKVGTAGGDATVSGLRLVQTFGGAAVSGARETVRAEVLLNSPTSPSNTNRNYVAGRFDARASTPDNGTLPGNPQGAVFAMNPVAQLNAGATGYLEVAGGEVNVGMEAGASAARRIGWSIVGYGSGTAAYDTALSIGSFAGGVSWGSGINFSNGNGNAPIDAGGTLIQTSGNYTIANGIELSSANITGNLIRGKGLVTMLGSTSGSVALAVQPAAGAYAFNLPTSAGTAGQPLLSGGGGSTAQTYGTLGVAGGGTGDTGTAWTAYTPTLSCAGGSLTSASANGWYKTIGKTVHVNINVGVTTIGSCAAAVQATLPLAAARASCLAGNNVNTNMLLTACVGATSATLVMTKYDNSGPGVTSAQTMVATGVYESQ